MCIRDSVYLDGKVALHKLSGNALSVLVGYLAAGESMTLTFEVQVLEQAAGTTLQNSVTVSGDNGSGTAKMCIRDRHSSL